MANAFIEIKNMRVQAFHGVMAQERTVGNLFEVSLRLEYPCQRAMEHDELHSAINYAIVAEIVHSEMLVPSKLLENVAWRIRCALLKHFPRITGGFITVSKITPPIPYELDNVSFTYVW